MESYIIGIDLGGTRIKAVALDLKGNILCQHYQPTHDGNDSTWKNAILEIVDDIIVKLQSNPSVIGISAPGLPNANNSSIAFMPSRLQGLENFEWNEFFKIETFVLNDAISAMMAEARFGAAIDRKNVVMLTLGTGVGGAILIEGKPYQGAFNKAGHIGHMVIDCEGEPDCIGMPGSLEDAIGNCTIEKRTSGKFNSTRKLLQAYANGDAFAAEVWLTSVKKLAIGIATLTNILSPDTIILGGGITEAEDDLFEPLKKYLSKYEWRAGGNQTQILKAQFGDLAGAVGAACFARETFENKHNINKTK